MPDWSDPRVRWLVAIVLAGVFLRLGMALYLGPEVEPTPSAYDQIYFHDVALNLLAGEGFAYSRPPWPFIQPGAPTAYTSFLYQLFLAAIYFVLGPHPLLARIVQALICSLMPLQVYWLTRRFVAGSAAWGHRSEAVAIVAAAITAGYAYFVYFSATLMTEGLYLMLIAWSLWLTLDLIERPTARAWAVWGLAAGLAVLLRQVFMPMAGLLFLFVAWRLGRRLVLRDVAISIAVAAALILPWTARNYAVFGRFLLLNSQTGQVFWNANHPDMGVRFDNYMFAIPEDLRGANEVELSDELMRRGLANVADDPVRFVRLSMHRAVVYFRFWPSNESSLFSNFSRTLSFGVALPFMLGGLVLARREWRRWLPLYGFAAVYTALHLVSWAQIRYRMPVDLVLVPFAALAVVAVLDRAGALGRLRLDFGS